MPVRQRLNGPFLSGFPGDAPEVARGLAAIRLPLLQEGLHAERQPPGAHQGRREEIGADGREMKSNAVCMSNEKIYNYVVTDATFLAHRPLPRFIRFSNLDRLLLRLIIDQQLRSKNKKKIKGYFRSTLSVAEIWL